MRIEGFFSLVACVVLLFFLGFGLGAAIREIRGTVSETPLAPALADSPPAVPSR